MSDAYRDGQYHTNQIKRNKTIMLHMLVFLKTKELNRIEQINIAKNWRRSSNLDFCLNTWTYFVITFDIQHTSSLLRFKIPRWNKVKQMKTLHTRNCQLLSLHLIKQTILLTLSSTLGISIIYNPSCFYLSFSLKVILIFLSVYLLNWWRIKWLSLWSSWCYLFI